MRCRDIVRDERRCAGSNQARRLAVAPAAAGAITVSQNGWNRSKPSLIGLWTSPAPAATLGKNRDREERG